MIYGVKTCFKVNTQRNIIKLDFACPWGVGTSRQNVIHIHSIGELAEALQQFGMIYNSQI